MLKIVLNVSHQHHVAHLFSELSSRSIAAKTAISLSPISTRGRSFSFSVSVSPSVNNSGLYPCVRCTIGVTETEVGGSAGCE